MEDKKILTLFLGLLFLLITCCFWLGKLQERKIWQKVLPDQMSGMCEDCEKIGQMKGYQIGLKTCSDVLNSMDDGGHR